MKDKIGRHISGNIDFAADIARSIGCNSMQIFIGSPSQWHVKEIAKEEAELFRNKCTEKEVSPVVVHMPYLPNFASPNKINYEKSINSLKSNVERCNLLNAEYLVMHLGSSMGTPKQGGIKRVANAVSSVIDEVKYSVLLENQSGNKNSVGAEIEDLVEIKKRIGSKKVGYCIDTCHAFAAGYDIRDEEVLDEMNSVLNFDEVSVIHANDSQFDLNLHKDRHENIGKGYIGKEGFKTFLNYRSIKTKPILMETKTDRKTPDKSEIDLVRSLIK